MTGAPTASSAVARASSVVLLTLATGQFVMALDMTVMNTAIATVANDVGTDVVGIQTAITLYTLVMASLMITGGARLPDAWSGARLRPRRALPVLRRVHKARR